MDIAIRHARKNELNSIATIESMVFERPWSIENLKKEFAASFSIMLVAIVNDHVVGYITAWKIINEIQINRIAVLPQFRRKGIAKKLIEGVIKYAKITPPYKIFLEAREKNHEARAFYKAMGFRENGMRKGYYYNDNAILFEKEVL